LGEKWPFWQILRRSKVFLSFDGDVVKLRVPVTHARAGVRNINSAIAFLQSIKATLQERGAAEERRREAKRVQLNSVQH